MAARSTKKKGGRRKPAAASKKTRKSAAAAETTKKVRDEDETMANVDDGTHDASSEDDEVELRGGKHVGERGEGGVREEEHSTEAEEEEEEEDSSSGGSSSASSSVEEDKCPTEAEKGRGDKGELSDDDDDDVDGDSEDENEEESSSEEEGDDEDDNEDEDKDADPRKEGGKHFSDENAEWLKPKDKKEKEKLLSSSDEEDEAESEDEGEAAEEDELLEVERQAMAVDREMEEERAEAEEEMKRTIRSQTSIFHLPTSEELAEDEDRVVPPGELRERIDAILEVLADFKVRREPGRSRSEYVDQIVEDMAELFGYVPELVEHFTSMLGPAECLEFLTASDRPRPLVIRTNTLKTRRKDLAAALLKRGVTLDPLAPWSKVGLKIAESPVPVGATPEYLSGRYMVQSAASLCPVLALDPKPGERNLDMSAAPGGKTSYMAQLMRNTGVVVANDLKSERQKATVANMHRLGVRNVVTCVHDGRKLGRLWRGQFDRVLLDAPCSGLGVVSRDPSVKVQRTVSDVRRTAVLQKELLLSAIDTLNYKGKGGGFMVYSTCSVSVIENEEVVNYVLSKRDVRVVDSGLDFGKPGMTKYMQKRFHPSVSLTRRFYPHVHNMDGFFVAKLQKMSDRIPGEGKTKEEADSDEEEKTAEKEGGEQGKGGTNKSGKAMKSGRRKGKGPDADDDGVSSAAEVERAGAGLKRIKGEKRRKGSGGSGESDQQPQKKKGRDSKVSVPPTRQKSNKKSTSAKMTKPRRQKLVC